MSQRAVVTVRENGRVREVPLQFALVSRSKMIAGGLLLSRWKYLNPKLIGHTRSGRSLIIVGVLCVATLVRIPLLTPVYHPDVLHFAQWAWFASEFGLSQLYDLSITNYPPVYVHVLSMLGDLARAWQMLPPSTPTPELVALMKIPSLFSDLGLIYVVYRVALRHLDQAPAAMTAAAIGLNPALIYATAVWGQVDSLHTALMVLAVSLADEARPALAGGMGALAMLTKVQSLVGLPAFGLILLRQGSGGLIWAGVGGALAAGIVLAPLAGMPLLSVARVYFDSAGQWPFVTVNAFNLWYLLGAGGALGREALASPLDISDQYLVLGTLAYRQLGLLLFSVWVGMVVGLMLRRREMRSAWLGSALVSLGFFCLPTEIHERYLFPVIAFLALAMCLDARLVFLFTVTSISFWLNLVLAWPATDWLGTVEQAMGVPVRMALAVVNLITMGVGAMFLLSGPPRVVASLMDPSTAAQPR